MMRWFSKPNAITRGMIEPLRPSEVEEFDVVVVGSGAAGLTCAITAAAHKLSVLVLEKDAKVGGTTAISAGCAWIPRSHHNPESEVEENVLAYMRNLAGERVDLELLRAYLANGAAAIEFLERNTCVRWRVFPGLDYGTETPGAAIRPGRVLEPLNFDDRELGPSVALKKPPLPALTIFHGLQVDRDDQRHFGLALRSAHSFTRSAAKVISHYLRWLCHGRPVIRKRGNALAAMLFKSASDSGVETRTNAVVTELLSHDDRVTGVRYAAGRMTRTVSARLGVVMASGGFSANAQWRSEHTPFADQHIGLPPQTNRGEGLLMAQTVGGTLGDTHAHAYCYVPVSALLRNGAPAMFPHFGHDRCKPGALVVGPDGRRFVNEGCSYHDFVVAMLARRAVPAYLIGDRTFLRRYGMGWARPAPFPVSDLIRCGYLIEGRTLGALAEKLGIDTAELVRSVEQMNCHAEAGIDADFGKGSDAYSRSLGDPLVRPNPTLGRIDKAPFYAVRLHPGDTGTTLGLIVNGHGQCLNGEGNAIPGLLACGNDMHNPTLGIHPSSGANIGPAIAFGYAAGKYLASTTEASVKCDMQSKTKAEAPVGA
jgi:succinate dehydrogenase/fumarate reductase flavoprotein subunit